VYQRWPGVNFINIFTYKFFRTNVVLAAFSGYVLALAKNSHEKPMRKTLMKLTADCSNLVFGKVPLKLLIKHTSELYSYSPCKSNWIQMLLLQEYEVLWLNWVARTFKNVHKKRLDCYNKLRFGKRVHIVKRCNTVQSKNVSTESKKSAVFVPISVFFW